MSATEKPEKLDYSSLNPNSRRWHERAMGAIIAGGQAHRRTNKYTLRGAPAFVAKAKGAYFWDVDGRKYLDYLLAYGPILIGHADERINAAVRRQMDEGTIFSVEHPAVIELAEELCRIISCAERVTFLIGGSSATLAAVRCARAHTKREKIVRCGYHGWFDWCFPKDPGSPASERELVIEAPYNDLPALAAIFSQHAGQIACFIIEGWLADGPSPGYFDGVRRLCDEHGVVLILDEVKTGFRFHLGGAQEMLGVKADLAAFGKAMCNGYPGSVLVGRREILDARADTWIGATFHGDLLSVAAANAVIATLRQTDGLAGIARLGRRLMEGINDVFLARKYPLRLRGFPAMPELIQTAADDPRNPPPPEFAGKVITEWCGAMMRRGFFMTGHVWFISLSHTDEDIDRTIAAADDAVTEAFALLKDIVAGKVEALPYV